MGIGLVVRARLRSGWRTWLGIVLLGGIGLGAALGCLAGADRTETAYERFVATTHPADVEVGFDEGIPLPRRLRIVDRILALPQVESAATAAWVFHAIPGGSVTQPPITLVPFDEHFFRDIAAARVTDGRLPDPDREDEMFLTATAAEEFGLGVGDTIDLVPVPLEQGDRFFSGEPIDNDPVTFTVTGVGLTAGDLAGEGDPNVFLSPAYWEAHGGDLAMFGPAIHVITKPGQRDEFAAEVTRLLSPSAIDVPDASNDTAVTDATHVQAVALTSFAAVVGLTALTFVGLAFGRQAQAARPVADDLGRLGMTRRRRLVATAAPAASASAAIGLLAVAVAVAISPRFPFGLAGRAEPDRGLHLDAAVVVGGSLLVTAVLALLGVGATALALRRSDRVVTRAAPLPPLPLVPALGLGLAWRRPRSIRSVPLRTVVVTGIVGLAVVTATVTFGRSLQRLTDEPERYGWSMDMVTGSSDEGDTYDRVAPQIEADPRLGDWTVASMRELSAGAVPFWVMGVEPVVGDLRPVVTEGRQPVADDEIALGRQTLADLDAGVGDQIPVQAVDGGPEVEVEVVGVAVLPGGDHDFPGGLGKGGVMTLDGLAAADDAPRHIYLLDAAEGVGPGPLLSDLQSTGVGVHGPEPGTDIDNLDQASSVIPALALVVAVLAVVALAHGFLVTVRRRRPELAVLASLGLRPRQIRALVLWQALAVATAVVVVGLPLGIVLGRLAWAPVARGLGVADDAAIGLAPVLGLVAATFAVTLLVALPVAVAAARRRPDEALRAE